MRKSHLAPMVLTLAIFMYIIPATANAAAISVLKSQAKMNLEMSIQIPSPYDEDNEDWYFNDSYSGRGVEGARLDGEKSYGYLSEIEEGTAMWGYSEITSHSNGWWTKNYLHENFESDPGIYYGQANLNLDLLFEVSGSGTTVEFYKEHIDNNTQSVSLTDLTTNTIYDANRIELLDGHQYLIELGMITEGIGEFLEAGGAIDIFFSNENENIQIVPEPSILLILGSGMALLACSRRRKRATKS